MMLLAFRHRNPLPPAVRMAAAYAESLGARVLGYEARGNGWTDDVILWSAVYDAQEEVRDATGAASCTLDNRAVVAVFDPPAHAERVLDKAGFLRVGRAMLWGDPEITRGELATGMEG